MDGQKDYCRYLDHLRTIDICYCATWHQWNRYENTILLVSTDDDLRAGLMRERKDFKSTTQNLTVLQQNKYDRTCTFRRTREHAKDHSMRTWNGTAKIGKPTGRTLPPHHLQNNGGNTNTKTPKGETNIGGKSDGYRLFQSHIGFFFFFDHRFRVPTSANVVHATGCEDRHLFGRTFFSVSRS